MDRYRYVIVPIKVAALCIGTGVSKELRGKSFSPAHGAFHGLNSFAGRNKPFLSDAYVRRPFSTQSPSNVQPGVHLHWQLPAALKGGVETPAANPDDNQTREVEFPRAPNRWLVTRILTIGAATDSPETRIRSWIVESDYLGVKREPAVTNIPYFQNISGEDNLCRYLGRAIPLEENGLKWKEQEAPRFEQLTAVGYGEPAFASYYPDCRTVFGFHDEALLTEGFDVDSDILSYAVMGWYSNCAVDPVAVAAREKRLEKVMGEYRWQLPDGEAADQVGLICRGFTYEVNWRQDAPLLPRELDPNDISVAVGHNASEALAALLKSRKVSSPAGGETLLRALQAGHMETLNHLDPLSELDKALHKDTFGIVSGGVRWRIEPKNTTEAAPGGDQKPDREIPVEFIDPLNRLNAWQADLDRTRARIDAVRQQIFADWCKFMLSKYDSDEDGIKSQLAGRGGVNGIRKLVEASMEIKTTGDEDGAVENNLPAMEARVEQIKEEVTKITEPGGPFNRLPPDLELKPTEAPGYYFPNEPVFTIAGEALKPSSVAFGHRRYLHRQDFLKVTESIDEIWEDLIAHGNINGDGLILSRLLPLENPAQISLPEKYDDQRDAVFSIFKQAEEGILRCRTDLDLIASVMIQDDDVELKVARDRLPNLPAMPDVPGCAGPLLAELFFYLPCHGGHEIALAAAKESPAQYSKFRKAIERQMEHPGRYYTRCLEGGSLPPAVSDSRWKWPWHPLFLHWKICYLPLEKVEGVITEQGAETRNTFKRDLLTANFDFAGDYLELGQTRAKFADMDPPDYMGITVLVPGAVQNLQDRTEAFLKSQAVDWDLKHIRDLNDTGVLSQTITGFNESLLALDTRLQFPIADQPERKKKWREFTVAAGKAVGVHHTASPVTHANFNPIRAGYMRITGLRVVDAFGQHREIANPPTVVAGSFTPRKKYLDYKVFMPPRIVQPARMTGYFIPQRNPAAGINCHPENPILGWIVPNFLDRGLMIFDHRATALGIVKKSADACLFRPVPGKSPADPAGGGVQAIKNPFLQGLVNALTDKRPTEFDAFIFVLKKGLEFTRPSSADDLPLMSLMVGRPLALLRFGARLEPMGFPAVNQGWKSLVWDLDHKNRDMSQRDTADFDRVDLPLQLGCRMSRNEYNDGLIGYFHEIGAKPDYDRFFSSYAALLPEEQAQKSICLPENQLLNCRYTNDDAPHLTCLLLMDPHGTLNLSTGLLPGQQLTIPRPSYGEALNRMSYTFLAAPLLTDPLPAQPSDLDEKRSAGDAEAGQGLNIPVPHEPGYQWSWVTRRRDTYMESPISTEPDRTFWFWAQQEIMDGWLKLSLSKETPGANVNFEGGSDAHK